MHQAEDEVFLIYVQFLLPLQDIRCVTKLSASASPAAILGLHSRSVLLERKQATVKKKFDNFFANSTNRLFKNWFINTFTRSKKQCWTFQKLSNLDFIRSNQFKYIYSRSIHHCFINSQNSIEFGLTKCNCNFKWPFMQRCKCPSHNGTFKSFVFSIMN